MAGYLKDALEIFFVVHEVDTSPGSSDIGGVLSSQKQCYKKAYDFIGLLLASILVVGIQQRRHDIIGHLRVSGDGDRTEDWPYLRLLATLINNFPEQGIDLSAGSITAECAR